MNKFGVGVPYCQVSSIREEKNSCTCSFSEKCVTENGINTKEYRSM